MFTYDIKKQLTYYYILVQNLNLLIRTFSELLFIDYFLDYTCDFCENGIDKSNVERIPLEFNDEKEMCMPNTWFQKEQKKHTV